jgi:hypothetical protein
MSDQPCRGATSLSRSAVLALCAVVLCALTLWEGVNVGADRTLPGALARHSNAFAVAISCLSYGHCRGYTSLRSVNQALYDAGLNYSQIGAKEDFFHDAGFIDEALQKATSITDPGTAVDSMGPHEKGLVLFYMLSMALFGIKLSSLFYGFMLVFCVTVGFFAIAFYRDHLALAILVAACCAMYLTVPVVQALIPDTNAVHSSRFLPLLGFIPVLHLLTLFERGKNGPLQIVLAAGQATVLFFTIFSRLSGVWMVFGLGLWIVGRLAISMVAQRNLRPVALRAIVPGTLVGLVLIGLLVYPRFALDAQYLRQDETEYRTFWHHLLVAANFNPKRQEVTGAGQDIPDYGDLIAYQLFEKEIARRGENLSQYLMDDEAGWPLRTTQRQYDYKWGLYESVVKGIFLRLVAEHPLYVLKSIFFYEPLAIAKEFFAGQFVPPGRGLIIVAAASAICALALFGWAEVTNCAPLAWAALMFAAMSLLPAFAASVMPHRLVEPAFLLYAGGSLFAALLLSTLVHFASSSFREVRT